MQIKADVASIIEDVKKKSLDSDLFYDHVLDGTINQYYISILEWVCSDLLLLSVERAHLGMDLLETSEAADEIADAVREVSLLLSAWFLKDPNEVERDFARTIQKCPVEDIREARFLLRKNLLN